MHAFDSLVDINNIITGYNNLTLRNDNIKLYGYQKMYMDKDLIEDKLYELKYQFCERKINHKVYYVALFNNTRPFYD